MIWETREQVKSDRKSDLGERKAVKERWEKREWVKRDGEREMGKVIWGWRDREREMGKER